MDQSHLGSCEIKNVFSPDACNLCIEELSDIRLSLTHTVLNFDRFLHRVTRITRIFIANYFIFEKFSPQMEMARSMKFSRTSPSVSLQLINLKIKMAKASLNHRIFFVK